MLLIHSGFKRSQIYAWVMFESSADRWYIRIVILRIINLLLRKFQSSHSTGYIIGRHQLVVCAFSLQPGRLVCERFQVIRLASRGRRHHCFGRLQTSILSISLEIQKLLNAFVEVDCLITVRTLAICKMLIYVLQNHGRIRIHCQRRSIVHCTVIIVFYDNCVTTSANRRSTRNRLGLTSCNSETTYFFVQVAWPASTVRW